VWKTIEQYKKIQERDGQQCGERRCANGGRGGHARCLQEPYSVSCGSLEGGGTEERKGGNHAAVVYGTVRYSTVKYGNIKYEFDLC